MTSTSTNTRWFRTPLGRFALLAGAIILHSLHQAMARDLWEAA